MVWSISFNGSLTPKEPYDISRETRMKSKIWFVLTGIFTTRIVGPVAANACSVCWGGDTGPIADAFNWSVLFLMAAPYIVMGSIAGWLFYSYRRAAAKREQDEPVESLVHLNWNSEESGR
jgi:hypothetical protein